MPIEQILERLVAAQQQAARAAHNLGSAVAMARFAAGTADVNDVVVREIARSIQGFAGASRTLDLLRYDIRTADGGLAEVLDG